MECLNALQGKTVGLDTAPLIYFIEENPAYIETVRPFFEAMDRGSFLVVTSTVTFAGSIGASITRQITQNWQRNTEISCLIRD